MKELEDLQRDNGRRKGKAADLGGAMEATEEIRQWVSHFVFSFLSRRLSYFFEHIFLPSDKRVRSLCQKINQED